MKNNLELTKDAVDFINDDKLHNLIKNTHEDPVKIRDIFQKSKAKQALSVEETAELLEISSHEMLEELFQTARDLKRSIYGNRIVLFAPLYIGNFCVNNCQYCGFRSSLTKAVRRTLSDQELIAEVAQLEKEGHKRLILVYWRILYRFCK